MPESSLNVSAGAPPGTVVVMGVSGAGKTTLARALAAALGRPFVDADDLHAPGAVAKMARGEGLADAERGPWLDRVAGVVAELRQGGLPAVVACSALREAFRDVLRAADPDVRFVWLHAPAEVLRGRLAGRTGHFAGPALLGSQLDALEPPSDDGTLHLDARRDVPALVEEVRRGLAADGVSPSPPRAP